MRLLTARFRFQYLGQPLLNDLFLLVILPGETMELSIDRWLNRFQITFLDPYNLAILFSSILQRCCSHEESVRVISTLPDNLTIQDTPGQAKEKMQSFLAIFLYDFLVTFSGMSEAGRLILNLKVPLDSRVTRGATVTACSE